MKHWFVTVCCWLFLGAVLGTFCWYILRILWECLVGVCNDSDASAVGGVLGLVLLLGVPAAFRKLKRR